MKKVFLIVLSGIFAAIATPVSAQTTGRVISEVDRRIGPRDTFQKPIAYDIADHTVLLEGVLYTGGTYIFEGENSAGLVPLPKEWQTFYGGLWDLRIARRMSNSIAYGVDSRFYLIGDVENGYSTNNRHDVYFRGRYGQISYGNFDERNSLTLSGRSGLSGEANLFFDGYFNTSERRAFRYRARYSSFQVDAAVDDNGDTYNIGLLYRSPSTTRKDSWSVDYHGGDYFGVYQRDGISADYILSYGSWDFKIGGAWDQFDPYSNYETFDRVAGVFCASYKFHAFTWSAGVMLAETNGGELETTYTAGMRYDMARGLSWNLGYYYMDSESTGSDGNPVTAGDFSGVQTSVAYRF